MESYCGINCFHCLQFALLSQPTPLTQWLICLYLRAAGRCFKALPIGLETLLFSNKNGVEQLKTVFLAIETASSTARLLCVWNSHDQGSQATLERSITALGILCNCSLVFCVDCLDFPSQITRKYSTAMCYLGEVHHWAILVSACDRPILRAVQWL